MATRARTRISVNTALASDPTVWDHDWCQNFVRFFVYRIYPHISCKIYDKILP